MDGNNMDNNGRPTIYSEELATDICLRISQGESVRNITKDPKMPASSTIYKWLLDKDKKEFTEQYETACNTRAELMFEELIEIADDGKNDFMEKQTANGESYTAVDSEHISRSRLRVDTRKWYLSKVLPKKFGDKLDMTTNGKDIPQPILNGLSTDNSNEANSEAQN